MDVSEHAMVRQKTIKAKKRTEKKTNPYWKIATDCWAMSRKSRGKIPR
jgi:hypothetical protein